MRGTSPRSSTNLSTRVIESVTSAVEPYEDDTLPTANNVDVGESSSAVGTSGHSVSNSDGKVLHAPAAEDETLDELRTIFFESQSRSPTSLMSKKFEHAETGGVPYFVVHRQNENLANHLRALDHELMDKGNLRLDVFNEELEFDLLFGRNIPVEGDHEGKKLLSGRVGVTFHSLRKANPSNTDLKRCLKEIRAFIQTEFGGFGKLDKISVVIRPAGRAEAQLEHVDGHCGQAGMSTSKSILIPIRRQRSTLFVGARKEADLMSGSLVCPILECGDVVELDTDRCVHLGYCCGCTPSDDVVSMLIFASITMSTRSSPRGTAYEDFSERIGCLPHTVFSTAISVPPVQNCVCCGRDIFHRVLTRIRCCGPCTDADPSRLHVVCDACTRWPCEALSPDKLATLEVAASTSSLMTFIHTSLVDDYGASRRCGHPCVSRISVDRRQQIRLYFSDIELTYAARWVVMLHTSNVLDAAIIGTCDESVMAFIERSVGGCQRQKLLVTLMFTFICVYALRIDDNPAEALFFNSNTIEAYIAARKEQLRGLIAFCSTPSAGQYHAIAQPFEVLLRRNMDALNTRCTCSSDIEASCLSRLRKGIKLPRPAVIDQRYCQFALMLKDEYMMRCSDGFD